MIGKEGRELTGTLRVDISETLLCYRMQPVIQEFRKLAPQVRLIIRGATCPRISENLREGSCDLGVCYMMEWNREILDVETISEDTEIILVAAPDFAYPDFVTPHQVKPVSLIIDEPENLFRRQLENYLREKDIALDETMELWSTEAIKRCVMSNLGFAFLPRFAVEEELAEGKRMELFLQLLRKMLPAKELPKAQRDASGVSAEAPD